MLLSLFAGCGGLDIGFEQAGFTTSLAYDIRPHSISSWNANRKKSSRGKVADISELTLAKMDLDHGSKFEPSAVIGGPPCQSFTRANRSKIEDDPRTKLVRTFFSVALRLNRRRPLDFILMENVNELDRVENGKLLEKEITRLKNNGFTVHKFSLNASQFGVAQVRKRLFVLALSKNIAEAGSWEIPQSGRKNLTVKDVISGLPEPVRFRRGLTKEDIQYHPNHWCMQPKSKKFTDGTLTVPFSTGRCFKTLDWNRPSYTVSYGHREVHVHPKGHRRLSVYEAMKLQGFPNKYVLEGTLSAQIDQVSEAVPPPLAKAVAKSISTAIALAESVYAAPALSKSSSAASAPSSYPASFRRACV